MSTFLGNKPHYVPQMDKANERIDKLITRKKEYLNYLVENGKQKNIDAIKTEINIIENFRTAYHNEYFENGATKDVYINDLAKEIFKLKETIVKLEGICLLYGISGWEIQHYAAQSKKLIIQQLLFDQSENVIRIPEKIKPLLKKEIEYYGEQQIKDERTGKVG